MFECLSRLAAKKDNLLLKGNFQGRACRTSCESQNSADRNTIPTTIRKKDQKWPLVDTILTRVLLDITASRTDLTAGRSLRPRNFHSPSRRIVRGCQPSFTKNQSS